MILSILQYLEPYVLSKNVFLKKDV